MDISLNKIFRNMEMKKQGYKETEGIESEVLVRTRGCIKHTDVPHPLCHTHTQIHTRVRARKHYGANAVSRPQRGTLDKANVDILCSVWQRFCKFEMVSEQFIQNA